MQHLCFFADDGSKTGVPNTFDDSCKFSHLNSSKQIIHHDSNDSERNQRNKFKLLIKLTNS